MKFTKKSLLVVLVVSIMLVLAGCQAQQVQQESISIDDMMADMPCHRMPDGTWMGRCDEKTVNENQEFSRPVQSISNGLLPGQDSTLSSLPKAKSSTIIDLADGEIYQMDTQIIKKVIKGKEIAMYGYNGMIPGPALRVKQGSTIYVNFTNNIDMNTTVHWHGLRHDIKDDGVPGTSQPPMAPGDSFLYELYFPDDGIFWYHPHIREDIQQDSGLSGNMLVTPSIAYNPVNREELIILDDILLDRQGEQIPFGIEHANYAVMGRFGNTMLINGETSYNLEVDKGEVVRFYVTNVANVRPFNFSIEGAQMKLVGGDLGEFEQEEFVDSIVIAPAVRYFVDVYFENTGTYNLMNINPHEEYILGTVTVRDEEVQDSFYNNFLTARTNQHIIDDIARFEPYFDKEPEYNLTLTIDMMGMLEAMQNMPCHVMGGIVMGDCSEEKRAELEGELEEGHGKMTIEWEDEMNMKASGSMVEWIIQDANSQLENMNIGMNAKVGDVIKIKLFNDPESMHPMQHPIHLHGQRFIVTSIDGEPVTNKVWTDTILIPIGSTVEILVDVTNPGDWMMHCHIAEHLEAGMMTDFTVTEA